MTGNDPTSPSQGLNPNLPPRVAITLSREQFLYSLARTPTPARFQRPRSNCQVSTALNTNVTPGSETTPSSEQFLHSLSGTPSTAHFQQPRSNRHIHRGLNSPFQTGGIEGSATRYPHDATGVHGFGAIGGPNSGLYSEPPGENSIPQTNQSLEKANKRHNFIPNEAVTNIQRLAPEAESRSPLRAAQIPTPSSERSTIGGQRKTGLGTTASDLYSIAPSPPSLMTSVGPVELGERNTPSNVSDESGYGSNDSSGEESGSLYTDSNVPLSGNGDYENLRAANADRISPGPPKKKLKRPSHSYSEIFPQNVALQVSQRERAEKAAPGEICRTFDRLQLVEERVVQNSSLDSGEGLSDDGSSMMESQLITGDVLFEDDSSMIESRHIVPETSLVKNPNPSGAQKRHVGHVDYLDLSRAFGVEPSLHGDNRGDAPTPIGSNAQRTRGIKESGRTTVGDKSQKRNADFKEIIDIQFGPEHFVDDSGHGQEEQRGSTIDAKKGGPIPGQPNVWQTKQAGQVSGGNPSSVANYETPSIIEDYDMDVDPSPQSEESDNDGSFSDSPLLDISPAKSTFKRRVAFNEDVEIIRQQLAMVSAPFPVSTASSEDGADYDHMIEDGEDDENDGDDDDDDNDDSTHSEGSDSHASENGSEVGSSADEHSIGPSSPRHDRRSLNTTLPSTPIRRWAEAEELDSSSGEVENEMLDDEDEMILDDTSNTVSKRHQVSDAVHAWGKGYDGERLKLSPSCPWAPRRSALPRHSTGVDGDIYASPSFPKVPRKKTVNNIRLSQSQMDWGPTQPATPMPQGYHRAPSIELGNAGSPPLSFYSQSITDSQTSRVVDLSYQSKKFMVADVPSYFSAASRSFDQLVYKPTMPIMRSRSMPLRSQYFAKERQCWSTGENISSNFVSAGKVASFMGSQDEGNTGLKALTRHISIGFGTPDRRRRNPSLSFRPPLKHI
ncbi:hypothetical protein VE03_01780 [Pseudogymnoascus sp. 23342-1-I1]|nr:hypothetical protein VE03_01780 [Pseudogymnoascus sp. 23342-1-I1]